MNDERQWQNGEDWDGCDNVRERERGKRNMVINPIQSVWWKDPGTFNYWRNQNHCFNAINYDNLLRKNKSEKVCSEFIDGFNHFK